MSVKVVSDESLQVQKSVRSVDDHSLYNRRYLFTFSRRVEASASLARRLSGRV